MRPAIKTVRSRILALLFAFSFMAYVQRTSVSIAAERMMPTLGLSQVQVGWLLTAFLIGYMAFQLPGALFGRWLGSRRTMTAIGLVSLLATCATCLAPKLGVLIALFPMLLLARFTLGVAQAGVFPVCSGVVEKWVPSDSWASAQGLLICGMWLGSAATAPAVAWIMGRWDWQTALYVTSMPTVLLVVIWQWYARDVPADHPDMSAGELAQLRAADVPLGTAHERAHPVAELFRNRPLLLVTLSYFLMNYVFYLVAFWCFLYLVEDRHFSTLQGGWLASLPFLAAAIASSAGGKISDRLCERLGDRVGFRVLPLIALPAAALFLYMTITAVDPYWAVCFLSLAFGCIEVTEGPFWAVAMRAAPANTMNATAILNTGGNLGGVVATPIIAALSAAHSWGSVFATGAVLSVIAAILWIWIEVPSSSKAANTAVPGRSKAAASGALI